MNDQLCHYTIIHSSLTSLAHLDGPASVWLSDAQVYESHYRQTHVEPVAEAEVVDQLEHVLHTQEDQSHHPLKWPRESRCWCSIVSTLYSSRLHNTGNQLT